MPLLLSKKKESSTAKSQLRSARTYFRKEVRNTLWNFTKPSADTNQQTKHFLEDADLLSNTFLISLLGGHFVRLFCIFAFPLKNIVR